MTGKFQVRAHERASKVKDKSGEWRQYEKMTLLDLSTNSNGGTDPSGRPAQPFIKDTITLDIPKDFEGVLPIMNSGDVVEVAIIGHRIVQSTVHYQGYPITPKQK